MESHEATLRDLLAYYESDRVPADCPFREGNAAALRYALAEIERLRAEVELWRPLTTEEAERAFAEAEAVPMSEDEIRRIVDRATDPAERLPNSEQAQLAADNKRLKAAVHRLQVEEGNFATQERNAVHQELSAAWSQEVKELEKVIDGQKEEIDRLRAARQPPTRHERWEDEPKADNSVVALSNEFDKRLPHKDVEAIHQQDRED